MIDRLPSAVILGQVIRGLLIVSEKVATKRANEDHGDHAGQEEHDHRGVDERHPVNLAAGHLEVQVPTRSPLGRGFLRQKRRGEETREKVKKVKGKNTTIMVELIRGTL